MKKPFFLFAALALTVASLALAQTHAETDKSKRPSPPASAEHKFADGASLKIDYSSPRMKGRKIFGAVLVPYGQLGRTGANEATSFVTSANLTIGGKAVPAGSYTLFTIPGEKSWTLILSKKTGQWGTDYPGEKEDLLRVEMQVSATAAPVENFTIALDGTGPKSATLRLEWESTRASVAIVQP